MLKKFTIAFTGLTLCLGAYYFVGHNKESKRIGLFDRKNPYSRKPASLPIRREVVQKEVKKEAKVETLDVAKSRLAKIKDCYTQKCNISSNDSREYDLSVGQSLKKELFSLYEQTLRNEVIDDRITEIGIEYLGVSDGHVKEAALLLLSTQEPSQEALNAITENVLDYHDANLIGLALMELEKYKTGEFDVVIKDSFIKNFRKGSLLVKEALAKGIYKFVNEENRNDYGEILRSLPKNSKVRKNLKATLDRYDYNTRL